MAKSALDLRGAKARNMRLDVELLGRAVEHLTSQGFAATGYFLVLTAAVAKSARRWCSAHQAADNLYVILAELPEWQLRELREEKERNARGTHSGIPTDSIAAKGKEIAESWLRTEITQREPAAVPVDERPLGVNWDYVGVVQSA